MERADQLAQLAQAGSEAVDYLSSGTSAPAGWKAAIMGLLTTAKRPCGIVRFTILEPLAQLVAAVP